MDVGKIINRIGDKIEKEQGEGRKKKKEGEEGEKKTRCEEEARR